MINIKLTAEREHLLTEVLVTFCNTDNEQIWHLRGHYTGYDLTGGKEIGYVVMPIKGYSTKVYDNDILSEVHTQKFPPLSKKQLRIIWNYLIQFEKFEHYKEEE